MLAHPIGAHIDLVHTSPLPWLTVRVSRPQREHTELEEELHEQAHIDYDRVAIVCFPHTFHTLWPHLIDEIPDSQSVRGSVV